MRIAWLNNYATSEHPGGAERTNEIMIKHGKELGHEIVEVTPEIMKNRPYYVEQAKLVVLNNINNFSRADIRYVMDQCNYVNYLHDYDNIELVKQNTVISNLFTNSQLNILLSPLHLSVYQEAFPEQFNDKTYLQPSPVEGCHESIITQHDMRRIVFVGNICPEKGLYNVLKFAQALRSPFSNTYKHVAPVFANYNIKNLDDVVIEFYGWGSTDRLKKVIEQPNCVYKGQLTHEEMLKVYHEVGWLIHFPVRKEPYGRAVVEAFLSGCKLIVDQHTVGCRSYDWNWGSVTNIRKLNDEHANNFWKTITSL